MKPPATAADDRAAQRLAALYSLLNSMVWGALCMAPLGLYCYQWLGLTLLWWFLAVSAVPWFLPRALLARLRFAPTVQAYRRLGMGLAQQLTRNGVLVNWLVRRRYPHYRFMRPSPQARTAVLNQSYMYEKFHWSALVFYALVTAHAWAHRHWLWGALVLLCNVVFNLSPILLQQYVRLRLAGLQRPAAKPRA